jgi:Putative adhesin
MTFRPIYLPALLVVAALGSGCDVRVGENGVSLDVAGGKASDEWTRTYTVTPGGAVEVVNVNGPIVVEAAKGPQVEIRATRVARAKSDEEAKDLLKKVEIKEEVSPGRVAVQTLTGTGMSFGRRSINVEYRVRVPAGLRVSVRTENGGIGLHDVNGTIDATLTNGGVRGTNVSGAVSARIVNGGIVMDMARVAGPIELESVNGGIRLDIPADLNADLEASAINGGVSTDDGLKLQTSERARTKIIGKLNGGGPRISATTVNGGVRLRVRDGSVSKDAEGGDEAGEVVLEQGR